MGARRHLLGSPLSSRPPKSIHRPPQAPLQLSGTRFASAATATSLRHRFSLLLCCTALYAGRADLSTTIFLFAGQFRRAGACSRPTWLLYDAVLCSNVWRALREASPAHTRFFRPLPVPLPPSSAAGRRASSPNTPPRKRCRQTPPTSAPSHGRRRRPPSRGPRTPTPGTK